MVYLIDDDHKRLIGSGKVEAERGSNKAERDRLSFLFSYLFFIKLQSESETIF